jgi:hypothetical protein
MSWWLSVCQPLCALRTKTNFPTTFYGQECEVNLRGLCGTLMHNCWICEGWDCMDDIILYVYIWINLLFTHNDSLLVISHLRNKYQCPYPTSPPKRHTFTDHIYTYYLTYSTCFDLPEPQHTYRFHKTNRSSRLLHIKRLQQNKYSLNEVHPLCIITIGTEEYSLAQQYVLKLIKSGYMFRYTAIIRHIYNHLSSYIC